MLQRDLNSIAQMGLIERQHGKVRAMKHIISAFLPATVVKKKFPKKKTTKTTRA